MIGLCDFEAGNAQRVTDSRPSQRVESEEPTAEYVKLEEHVFSVKKRFLAMCKKAHAGHIGSSLSCAEILIFPKFAWMRDDATFILSKGHAAAALYSLLAETNVLSPRQIDSYYGQSVSVGTRGPD
jgi:transketolase